MTSSKDVKQIVKEKYSEIALGTQGQGCCGSASFCCGSSNLINFSMIENEYNNVDGYVPDADLGLGCGLPTEYAQIKKGDTVVDLGSGAGNDVFIARSIVGNEGKVIGIDMTEEMIDKAKASAKKYGYKNVEFRLGDIEKLPVDDNSIDVAISNCVVNLVPDKSKVFREVYRVLKKGGRMYISDIVLLKNLSEEQRNDDELIAGCVGGALLKDDYLRIIKNAGFEVNVLSEDKDISKRQYQGAPLESLKVEAVK